MGLRRIRNVFFILFVILHLLCCGSCKNKEKTKSDLANNAFSLSNETENVKETYRIINPKTNSAFAVNTEKEGIRSTQTEDVSSSSIFLTIKSILFRF